ncbi:Leucine carboxyl methyltransferase 2 [Haplosporangium sp. Z 767]|nr:Leucine carboxyl methyltransferase 2 [Haplosporangium sp. Z 11]KAF9192015.1 Leucine carboxyl methyltransferase 2 [Haplosporangium sp. Z 767]
MDNAEVQAADLAIQGTNTSSITSKRSIERLGYLDRCHIPGVTEKDSPLMFKYMVPKPSRRSPVINRAYHQRTEAIRILIEGWIEECEALGIEECVIVSLGCGFDPTYFRLATLWKTKRSKTKLKYVDVDYPTLIAERLYMVRNESTLFDLLPENPSKDDVGEFISDTYSCLGIDLRRLDMLQKGLEAAGIKKDGARMPILVISEVVLAYLDAEESDKVIEFFAQYPEATFILHEQCIPVFDVDHEDENLHPFALTMFKHFERTMTPLKTLREYRSIKDHQDRLQSLGWPNCDILNMNLFTDYVILPTEADHHRVSQLEPFDEHDELYWIGAYYFVAVATMDLSASATTQSPDVLQRIGLRSKLQDAKSLLGDHVDEGSYVGTSATTTDSIPPSSAISHIDVEWSEPPPFAGLDFNRKGHTLSILDDDAYIFGGFGLDASDHHEEQKVFQARGQQTRLGSMVQHNLVNGSTRTMPRSDDGPAPRVYHSAATTLDGSAIYIYGGRDGPNKVHNDVWRFTPQDGWEPLWRAKINQYSENSLPKGLFKHTANMMTIAGREMMVVFGGRLASGEANDQVWAFDLEDGQWGHFPWRTTSAGHRFEGLFSHSSVVVKDSAQQDSLIVVGGIRGKDEKVLNTVWKVTLGINDDEPQCWVQAEQIVIRASSGGLLRPRFGHTSVKVENDRIWVLGGVSAPGLLQWHETIIEIELSRGIFKHIQPSSFKELVMVGHATELDERRDRVIGVGGGGTCFGFGAWWDASGWALQI